MQNYVQAQNDVVVILILSLPYGSAASSLPLLRYPVSTVHRPLVELLLGLYIVVAIAGMAALLELLLVLLPAACCCPTISSVPFAFYFVFVAVVAYLSTIAVCCFK